MEKMELLRYLINGAAREGTNQYNKILGPLGITPAQAEVLSILGLREPMSLQELGKLIICQNNNPSRLLQRMVENGLVYKDKSTEDSRKLVLHLTEKGRKLIPSVKEKSGEFNLLMQRLLPSLEAVDHLNQMLLGQIKDTETEEKLGYWLEMKKVTLQELSLDKERLIAPMPNIKEN